MIDIEHEYREKAPNYSDAKKESKAKRKRRGAKIKFSPRYSRGEKTGTLRTFNRVRDLPIWGVETIAELDRSAINRDPCENRRSTTISHPVKVPDFSTIGKIAAWFLSE